MNEKFIYSLLKVIYKNSDINLLIREGLTFPQIADLSQEAIKRGLILRSGDKIILSADGLAKFYELEIFFKKTNKAEWISPALESRVSRIDKNDIFLPSQDELTFLE